MLPANVISTLNGNTFNAAPSDIRPENALFGTTRALTSLALGGLGCGPGPVGATILSHFSTKSSQIVDYAISGKDPITGKAVPAYTSVNVGAQVQVVLVNSTDTASGHLGNSGQFKNVDRFVLAKVQDGTLAHSRPHNRNGPSQGWPHGVGTRTSVWDVQHDGVHHPQER
jgi:hypothetical protein